MTGCERSEIREFLGRRNDTGVETSTAHRECRVRDAQKPPGPGSPPSAEPWSREGEFHWKNRKTRGIQYICKAKLPDKYIISKFPRAPKTRGELIQGGI